MESESRREMRRSLRQLSLLVVTFLVLAFSATVFQNCSSTGSQNQLYDLTNQPSECTADNCAQPTEDIQIQITNANPIQVTYKTEQAVDISGYCSTSIYPSSRFYYYMQDNTGATTVQETNANTSCNNLGRFEFTVPLTVNFNPLMSHTLFVVMKAVAANGQEIDSPLGTNQGQITITVIDN